MPEDKINTDNITFAIVVVALLFVLYHLYVIWEKKCKDGKGKSERYTIRQLDRPGSAYGKNLYSDPVSGRTIDDLWGKTRSLPLPGTTYIICRQLACSVFSPLSIIFRRLQEDIQSPVLQFFTVIDNPQDEILNYDSYPIIMRVWTDFETGESNSPNSGVRRMSRYSGSFDYGELKDWILSGNRCDWDELSEMQSSKGMMAIVDNDGVVGRDGCGLERQRSCGSNSSNVFLTPYESDLVWIDKVSKLPNKDIDILKSRDNTPTTLLSSSGEFHSHM